MPDEDKTQAQGPSAKDRQIRVFISSTFRDMQAERDYLVKFTFPQLRKLCESRGVTWGEVDLRWGVTDEQAAEGKVLPICLEEIKRCRPYFIGLLGERYGWIPEALPADLLEREPWLKEHLHGKTSVTELEILHGVLRNPQMAGQAYFYFRNPAYLNSIPEKDRKDFTAENANDAEKLRNLKDNIRRSGFPVRENYSNPKALGELVLADLTKVINDFFPEGSQPDPLDREAMDHEAYAQSRERVYIGRQEYFDRLDAHAAANDTQPLVILGESGAGKSALLANWGARYRQAHPEALVLQHYIGATPYSADWAAMLRRLMGEFKRRLGLQQDIPDQSDSLRSAFPNWLYMAAAKGRVVLALDALNQLEDRDGAPDLVFLPPVLPENVRLIVSTLPGRPLDETQKRNWPVLKVELLSSDERRKLIAEYLAQHAKSLNAARVERIAAAPPSANPLYLRVLLDELRLVRTHEELEERIGDYLKAESPYALYEKVIARWEQDYDGDSDLVGDTLSLLWAARRGLTETELLQAMGKDGEPLPRAKWSPLFLAMSDALISRGGLLTFAHDFLRTAVESDYLPTEQNQQRAHLRLADYFERQSARPRRTDELPWQLSEAHAWERLFDLLANRSFFNEAWLDNQFDVKRFWRSIEANSPFRMFGAYPEVEYPNEENDKGYLSRLGVLLTDSGHLKESIRLHLALAEQFEVIGDQRRLEAALVNLAVGLSAHGDFDNAMEALKKAESISRASGKLGTLATNLNNQARILYLLEDLDGAMKLLTEAERVCRELGDLDDLQQNLGSRAIILQARDDLDGATRLYEEKERLCRQLGNPQSLGSSLVNQGAVKLERGDLDGAMVLFNEAERIWQHLGYLEGVSIILSNKAVVLYERGQCEEALSFYKQAERIHRQLGNLDSVQEGLGRQAKTLFSQKNPDAAMVLLKEKARICLHLGDVRGLVVSLSNQALVLAEKGDAIKASLLADKAYGLATAHGYSNLSKEIEPILRAILK